MVKDNLLWVFVNIVERNLLKNITNSYIVVKNTGVSKVSFNNKKIPNDYFITMSTLDKDEVGVLTPFIITAYKASIQRDFEMSFSSEGDPAELTLTLFQSNSVRAQKCAWKKYSLNWLENPKAD